MVRNCDVIAGYKTYPHVDQYESGQLAGSILLRAMKGEVKPVMAWGNVPLLAQTLRQNTAESADEGLRRRRPRGRAQRPARRHRVRRIPAGRHPRCRD